MHKLVEICLFAAFGDFMMSSVRMLGDSRSSDLVYVHCDGTSQLQRRIWSRLVTCKRLGGSLAPSELIYRLSKGLASRNYVCLGLDHFWETSWFETLMLWILDPIRSNIAVR